jgi:hypothetical protein
MHADAVATLARDPHENCGLAKVMPDPLEHPGQP